ncbi:MAG: UDP-N-acetylmuramoyl-tripeptide--D-alanyl-D-alanine ligase [Microbacteriaceae bacterium]|nr:UDP-N-acetylmuramoyl-tripeptide--D-alanyl-D-alanine ligase [Microbacteriaceae bacterium]
MIALSLKEIAEAVSGKLVGNAETMVTGSVETDSRLCRNGSIFVAKPGEITDGHLFVPNAIANGAVVAIVERELPDDISQIVVEDSVIALGRLASYVVGKVRALGKLKVIAVTGSNGKTTTKNMLREILSQFGNTVAPQESYNNEVGAPYSMLRIAEDTEFLVLEYGADGLGSISYLVEICRPDIAIELKVGMAHAGEFGGIEITEKIKAELVTDLFSDDVALLNTDDYRVAGMAQKTKAKVITFGTAADADYRASNVGLTISGTNFLFSTPEGFSSEVNLRILGEHHVYNALASLSVAGVLGLDLTKSIQAIEAMTLAERWRMQLGTAASGLTVINDAYNASPDSMKAALVTLAELGKQSGKRTVAVLGEMAELGEFSAQEHDAIGRLVVRLNISQLVVVGQGAKLIHMAAGLEGSWDGESKFFEEISQALEYLRGMLKGDEILLVKSSKSANLRFLGDDLLEAKN